jgi:hypothetical protein
LLRDTDGLHGVPGFPLLPFFLVAFVLAWLPWAAVVSLGGEPGWLSAVLQAMATFAPGVAALVVAGRASGWAGMRKVLEPLRHYQVGGAWYALALLGPPLLMAVAVALHVALGGRPPDLPDAGRWLFIPGLLVLVLLIGGPLGEEPGWRGYALPILQRRFGPVSGALVLGLVWAVWHLPLRLIPGTPQAQLPLLLVVVQTVAVSLILAWILRSTGGSLLLVVLTHASINTWAGPLRVLPVDAGSVRPYAIATAFIVALAVPAAVRLMTKESVTASHPS